MLILACETSCDDTSFSLVQDGMEVFSVVVSTQLLHETTGGVVPEVAAREHCAHILPTLTKSMKGYMWSDIDYFAVTTGPGLVGSLLVGIETMKTLALLHNRPLIPVHHIEGHIYAALLERTPEELIFPAIVLTVSGGHNDLYLMPKIGEYILLGATRDDAAGEAFDKAARMLKLGFPGGPVMERLASSTETVPTQQTLPRAYLRDSYDFSFSGLKSELKRQVENRELTDADKKGYAIEFQNSVFEVLVKKTLLAAEEYSVSSVIVAGGVSASERLRYMFHQAVLGTHLEQLSLLFPKKKVYSTDNAAMIGAAAHILLTSNLVSPLCTAEEISALSPHLSYALPKYTEV